MLSVLDRRLKLWHVWLVNSVALAWFVGMSSPPRPALPGVKLFRCPIGLCLGYYSPIELHATLTRIGQNGREFLAETLLPLDMVLPALLLVALALTYVWFSRPGATPSVPLSAGARYAFLCVPLLLLPCRLCGELGPGRGPAGLPQHPLSARAPGELPDGREVAARSSPRSALPSRSRRRLGP